MVTGRPESDRSHSFHAELIPHDKKEKKKKKKDFAANIDETKSVA